MGWLGARGQHVRDMAALTLESAAHKITQMPAQKLYLADRGVIRTGAFADLLAFDPETVSDRADFDDPHQNLPAGLVPRSGRCSSP